MKKFIFGKTNISQVNKVSKSHTKIINFFIFQSKF